MKIRYYQYIGTVLCLLVVMGLLIYHYKQFNTFVIDDSAYDTIRHADSMAKEDPLVEKNFMGKSYILLAPFLFLGYEKSIFLVLAMLLALTLLMIHLIFEKNHIFLFLLLISPFFIEYFIKFNDYSILIPLLAICGYMLQRRYYWILLIPYCLIAFLDYLSGVFIFFVVLILSYRKQLKSYHVLLYLMPLLIFFEFPKNHFFFTKNILERLFVEFGAAGGIAIPMLFIAIIGLYVLRKNMIQVSYILLTAIILSFFKLDSALLLINLLLVYIASHLILHLINNKWESNILKQASIALIFCTLLFSGISYTNTIMDKQNDLKLINSLEWLNKATDENSIVFTHYTYGYKVKFFAERRVLLDSQLTNIRNSDEKYEDSLTIFESRNLAKTLQLLERYQIDYVLVTNEMKHGLVWNKDNEGLVFVAKNYNEFQEVFNNDEVTIYSINYSIST